MKNPTDFTPMGAERRRALRLIRAVSQVTVVLAEELEDGTDVYCLVLLRGQESATITVHLNRGDAYRFGRAAWSLGLTVPERAGLVRYAGRVFGVSTVFEVQPSFDPVLTDGGDRGVAR
ncbi:hypothetical protein MF406_14385 [Georgenia sp. TF02-10]|uniref:hypothetical protein n=1 Tax=Georgenia sp. TF02-10 TaxID=2917725 RepID=UPI001FA75F36|nr:hypothetical protein [Georgenia sp. TF02-10]UNX54120.1 hypothetical protein MF406_14385 [Georgenia sp. TF02-10]